jgi:hypothetical protein
MKISLVFIVLLNFSISAFSQKETPDSFLDFKLGMTLQDFQKKNTDASAELSIDDHLININMKDMTFYVVKRVTNTCKKVFVDCGFYNNTLAIIGVRYRCDIFFSDISDTLEAKYGPYSSSEIKEWIEDKNNYSPDKNYNVNIVSWETKSSILYLRFTKEPSYAELIYVDKAVQNKLGVNKEKAK